MTSSSTPIQETQQQQHSVSMSQLAQQEGKGNPNRTSQSDYNVGSETLPHPPKAGSFPGGPGTKAGFFPDGPGTKAGSLSAGSSSKTASLPAGSGLKSRTFPILPSGTQTESLPILPMPPGKKRHNSMRTIMNGKGQSILDIFAEDDAEENDASKLDGNSGSENDRQETGASRGAAVSRPV